MAMQNYSFAKRQRDLAKKRKQEEKRQRKTDARPSPGQESLPQPAVDENVQSPGETDLA